MKKILISLITGILLICALTICVSAAGSTSDEFAATPDTIEGVSAPTKLGTSERVVLLGNDGLYYTYPAYYVLSDEGSMKFVANNALNAALGYADGTKLDSYVVRIEIPTGITYIGTELNYESNLKYVKMSDTVTGTAAKAFQSCSNMETIILSNSLTTIEGDLCKGNSKITSLVIPASVTLIKGYCFDGCKISSLENKSSRITEIWGNAFSGCPIENDFYFPSTLTSIGAYAFNGAKFANVDLPNSITSLGSGVFQGCTNLTYVRIPENVTQVPHDFLKSTQNSSITLVVPKNCTSIYSQYSLGNSGIKSIIFTGDSDDAFIASVTSIASGWLSKITYANHCEIYYNGVHTNGASAPKFAGAEYVSDYILASTCQKCDLDTVVEKICGPLFNDLGYAKEEDGTAFTYDIIVNKSEIIKYQNYTSKTLSYGFIVGAHAEGQTGDIIGVDGTVTIGKAVVIDFVQIKYDNLDKYCLKMTGIAKDQYDMLLYCNTYVNDGTAVSYLGAVTKDGKALAISYETLPVKEEK